jgi:hypothetical protein
MPDLEKAKAEYELAKDEGDFGFGYGSAVHFADIYIAALEAELGAEQEKTDEAVSHLLGACPPHPPQRCESDAPDGDLECRNCWHDFIAHPAAHPSPTPEVEP